MKERLQNYTFEEQQCDLGIFEDVDLTTFIDPQQLISLTETTENVSAETGQSFSSRDIVICLPRAFKKAFPGQKLAWESERLKYYLKTDWEYERNQTKLAGYNPRQS